MSKSIIYSVSSVVPVASASFLSAFEEQSTDLRLLAVRALGSLAARAEGSPLTAEYSEAVPQKLT